MGNTKTACWNGRFLDRGGSRLSRQDGLVVAVAGGRDTLLDGGLLTHRDPFLVAHRVEVARSQRFVAEVLLFFEWASAGGCLGRVSISFGHAAS